MKKGEKHSEETKQKISNKMEGNDNAEKWTEEVVEPILKKMIQFAKRDDCHLKIELLLEFEIYNRDWFKNMAKKFSKNETVFPLLRAIDMICEKNSYKAGATGGANANLIKMNLATHYNWSDKKEVDQKVKLSPIEQMSDEELQRELDKYNNGQT